MCPGFLIVRLMSCVLARFNEDAPRQPNNCNDCEHQGDEDAQCAGGGWVPKRLICRCHGFSLPSRLTRSTSAKGGPPAKSGNGDVADNVQEPATKGSKPVAAASDKGAPPLSDAGLLVAKDAQIADLTVKLSNHPVDNWSFNVSNSFAPTRQHRSCTGGQRGKYM